MTTNTVFPKGSLPLQAFLAEVADSNGDHRWHAVAAHDLRLDANGYLSILNGAAEGIYPVTDSTLRKLAKIAEIPVDYFKSCTRPLRALNFEQRLAQKVPRTHTVHVLVCDGIVQKILNSDLLVVPVPDLMNTISNSIPEAVSKDEVHVLDYSQGGVFEVSLIAPSFAGQPKKGDLVAFGIGVSLESSGSVQIHSSAFRYLCGNGALSRTCESRRHRLRRPLNRPGALPEFLKAVARHARDAWEQWVSNRQMLGELTSVTLDNRTMDSLIANLPGAPYRLSQGVAREIRKMVEGEAKGRDSVPTMYDVWNAVSWLGTHETEIRQSMRRKLRLAAGEFTRTKSRICESCLQLVMA